MLGNLNGWHLVIILFLVLLLFGAPKLPGLARSIGQSMKIFKSEVKSNDEPGTPAPGPDAPRDEVRHPGPAADTPRPDSSSDEPTSKP
ncbi:sec-independent protein translocase protein TatA [Paramicrobacterium humi]|uniref:Sec-independent protein translocase protein TatA n=1 Tax=Paramicrobacterium humi TaxID=640635 RepID=A0A1H4R516_9MICO|nr:twin-arginine translocase TatA/TatE family subunit [Microbacterium humi]SEC26908.1 sec-independent protein translocase protein TatA [Microbacterium humi]